MITLNDLVFEDGQCVVELEDDYCLSIVTPERQSVLDIEKIFSPSYMDGSDPWLDIQADDETFEIAVRSHWHSDVSYELPELEDYKVDDGAGNTIYSYVPRQLIVDIINSRMTGTE